MKLTVEQAELAEAARWVARHIPPSAADPTALAVLLDADGDALTVAYNSVETAASVTVDAHVLTPGRAAVSGKIFADIVGALPPVPVDLAGDESGVDVVGGANTFRLGLLDTAAYPALPPMPPISGTVPAILFASAVANVAVAVDAAVAALPELGGIRIRPETDGHLTFTATDRYRVAVQRIPWQPADDAVTALLPGRALVDIAKTAGSADHVDLALTGRAAGIQAGRRTSVSRLLSVDKFPNADAAFPTEYTATVTCDADELAATVKRISLLLEGDQAVELAIVRDHMTLQALRNPRATGAARIDCRLDGADTFDVAFNPRYLLDGLAPIDGDVAIDLTTHARPALIHADINHPTYQYLVVPVRDPAKAAKT
ncbi:DNA polymerase III subunit beta [Streptomyces rimosus]|uniref:DNA polymerase III subunit beta n=1 Tax=Streptomyces rimosus TaxID=1927 RepID=UPI0004CB7FDB|nr:DNA polymerase III subunit beta [Streptomyces rimosus]